MGRVQIESYPASGSQSNVWSLVHVRIMKIGTIRIANIPEYFWYKKPNNSNNLASKTEEIQY